MQTVMKKIKDEELQIVCDEGGAGRIMKDHQRREFFQDQASNSKLTSI